MVTDGIRAGLRGWRGAGNMKAEASFCSRLQLLFALFFFRAVFALKRFGHNEFALCVYKRCVVLQPRHVRVILFFGNFIDFILFFAHKKASALFIYYWLGTKILFCFFAVSGCVFL